MKNIKPKFDLEVVENFPVHMVCYAMYGDSEGLNDEEMRECDKWMEENDYTHLVDAKDFDEGSFTNIPCIGLPCECVEAIFEKVIK